MLAVISCVLTGCVYSTEKVDDSERSWEDEVRKRQEPVLKELETLDVRHGKVTFYTIDPESLKTDENFKPIPQPPGVPSFRNWKVLGSVVIESETEKIGLLTELVRGGRETDGRAALCFLPRHGVSIETKVKTVDIIVCFECRQVDAYGLNAETAFLISPSPVVFYNKIAKKYGLVLAK